MPNFNCRCDDGFYYGNETLADLRRDVLVRLGYAAQADNPPPGMADLLDSFLKRAQAFLYRRYKDLRTERIYRWTMTPGERFYGIRDNIDDCTRQLDSGKITGAWVEDLNGTWLPLTQGIQPEFYTSVDFNGLPARFELRQQLIEIIDVPGAIDFRHHHDIELVADRGDDLGHVIEHPWRIERIDAGP